MGLEDILGGAIGGGAAGAAVGTAAGGPPGTVLGAIIGAITGPVLVALFKSAIPAAFKFITFLILVLIIAVAGFGVSLSLLFHSIPWQVWLIGVGILLVSLIFGGKK